VRELLEIRRLLAVAHTVTLTGPGGVGKSRLVLRTAHQVARHFPDGVWWVELADVDSPDLVVHAVAHSLGVQEQSEVGIEASVLEHLRERRLLIVLDNCEHVVDACRELVSAIVSRHDEVRVLSTSRQRLGVQGESVVIVSPLDVPGPGGQSMIAAVAEIDSVNLLIERTRALVPDFTLTNENSAAAIEICRRLDGLPLAIELAAVRLASLTPVDVLDRLDDRFRLLTADRDQQSRRHQALSAAVELSHELLGREEQVLWRRCSVFAGSFGIDAVEAVCPGDGLDPGRILDVIGRLIDNSILTIVHGAARTRYRLLETMRLYGAERLRDAGEEFELRHRHASWYASLVSAGGRPWWGSPGQVDAIDMLDAEWANIEVALEHFAGSSADAQIGLRMATDLVVYWVARGRYSLGRQHLDGFLARDRAASAHRALGLWGIGWLAQSTGDFDTALMSYEQARDVSEQAGADREYGWAQMGLGYVRLRRGEVDSGIADLLASKEHIPADDAAGRGFLCTFLSIVAGVAGQSGEGLRQAQEGLDVTAPLGDSLVRSVLYAAAGMAAWQLDDGLAAKTSLEHGVGISDRLGYRGGLAMNLDRLAWIAADEGQFERAAMLSGAVDSLNRDLGVAVLHLWDPYRERCAEQFRAGLGEVRAQACFDRGFALAREGGAASLTLDVDLPPARTAAERDLFALTQRELEVARLVAEGKSNPAIAEALFVSTATVKTHVSHILQKLALDSRVQLANWVTAHAPAPD
jgi:non-specific serine/threonine protein kinase